jgi:serine/threonine protein phosphatase PrpC
MKLHCTTHGVSREPDVESDDALRFQQRDNVAIAVVADGLGASKDGGTAARRAVDMMVDYFLARPQAWTPRRALTEFAGQINRLFFQESQIRYGAPEVLCTLSVVALENGRLYGLNVGDSPVYLWRRGQLTRLSEVHSLAQDGMQHVLTRAVGLSQAVEPHVFEHVLEDGDQILLCSDGVSATLSDEKLAALLSRGASARTIVNAAREIAAENVELRDDASAIQIEVEERGWSTQGESRSLEVLGALHSGQTIDEYRLIRSLQEGERVWLVQRDTGEKRVLKFPALDARDDDARRDAFIREAWQASRIDSPDFVRASVPMKGTIRYYEMEYIDAPTLREVLKSGPLPVEEAVELGRFLLRAGQFLLARDLAHGDIKPENILVLRDQGVVRFKLLDLGSASELFSITTRAGTASYLAPERFQGAALAERTEIFAIGVTLYEALTGHYPYGEIERFQTPRFDSPPKRLTRQNSAVPEWLDSVVLRSLAPEPERRYQNFSEMMYELQHPERVVAYYRKDAPLLERNPLLFYKLLCLVLLLSNAVLIAMLARAGQR